MLITPSPNRVQVVSLDDFLNVPVPLYSADQLPYNFCARYARLCADFIFGKKFPVSDSWYMRQNKHVFTVATDNSQFPNLVQFGIIKPGMMVGVYCSDSEYGDAVRLYTHMSLYLGQQRDKPLFLEQFMDEIRIMNLRDYDLEGLQIREVLCLREDKPFLIELRK